MFNNHPCIKIVNHVEYVARKCLNYITRQQSSVNIHIYSVMFNLFDKNIVIKRLRLSQLAYNCIVEYEYYTRCPSLPRNFTLRFTIYKFYNITRCIRTFLIRTRPPPPYFGFYSHTNPLHI